jgi:hypothetical protein
MSQYFIYAISFLYSIGGIVTFIGFFPTMRDLWKSHPSANVHTYIIWTLTTLIASLYAIFVVKDLLFIIVVNLQLTACLIILMLSLKLKLKNKQKNAFKIS